MSNRPISQPLRRETEETWKQVIDLFRKHGLSEPPVRLRDELVVAFEWAWYGAALQSAAETPEPAAWLCVHKKSGKRELRFQAIADLPYNREKWDWCPLFTTADYSKPASNYNPGGNLIGGESSATETPAPSSPETHLAALQASADAWDREISGFAPGDPERVWRIKARDAIRAALASTATEDGR